MKKSCHTRHYIMSHVAKESCPTCKWVMSHVCPTYKWVMSHVAHTYSTSHLPTIMTHTWIRHITVMPHVWMSHVTHINTSCFMLHTPAMSASCPTYQWVMSPPRKIIRGTWLVDMWDMTHWYVGHEAPSHLSTIKTHIWIRHVTHIYECLMSHI